ncbi:unnamed protein product [Tuber aestivum]|uniref:CENP-V/GFA domain-containing protein n=1 Tax=Tuber aestivum TaxID=59557 RepID=A0A292Q424_9PEZI|nr:unnamed protein product [Tuber aestivum]
MSEETHTPVTGGCLCGAIHYKVSFPAGPETEWPPVPHICQCTQCRKNTGSLVVHFFIIEPKTVTWSSPAPTYREYSASPGRFRGFCDKCGTLLTWRSEASPNEIEITTGSLDESVLKEFGDILGKPVGGQYWCSNAIKGLTDVIPVGDRYTEGPGSAKC